MCGIVGYIGKQRALPILLDGIKALEYRGYDSAGLAIVDSLPAGRQGTEVYAEKAVGRVSNLEEKARNAETQGALGIVHSRWATHGGVTELNAHPHTDCKGDIWLVHNGIIENYKEIKSRLAAKGHLFASETDTEVLVHLIEDKLNTAHGGAAVLEDGVREALNEVRGTYGIAVIDRREPKKLVAARNFSPLLIGVGNGEYFVASDASPVIRHTRDVVYLNDGEMAVLMPDRYRIMTLDQKDVVRKAHVIEWSVEEAQKGGHPHFMLKEIMEQPEAIQNSLRGRLLVSEGNAKLGGLAEVAERLRGVKRLLIAACGTAHLAGRVGEYMLEEYAGIPVEVDIASEFRYRKPVFREGDALLVISQSGETADTLAALREAKQKGVMTLGIVNAVGSTIARETDAGIYQHIGPEIGVASTKAFTSQVSILVLLTLFLGRQRELSVVMGKRIAEELQAIPALIGEVLATRDAIRAVADKYRERNNFLYLGRKYNYPVAMEGALKIKEISYVHAEGCSAGEMKHGPIAMIDDSFPSIVIAPKDSVYEKNVSNIQEVKARGGPVIAVATRGDSEIAELADDVLTIPKTLEMLTPILAAIPLQLFAYEFGVARGLDVDKPRNLAKSVTVE
ncbi:MAG: glutamine--fructose-6-phosphate aminotransferase [Candidatus Liptonbacteria bacterium RIFCSPLOWO2_12_FULL_60_15]|uniref:Glutamine--fructose-6-phosphate aminotransferase [isomerizing] n=1 Tax=Candidatus Liptonbacteria bacterium RIFCSPLOWO2_12_FULL_60_15 TaxID=1798653 RepID=A0A1G2CRA2_9BACT|nr:MAG: glutamine--fructose-6-phosphate aminotransferase [Candidatus Liptonbacteria bacterium RIFCSPLOWO2_12_FULL_60_15]